MNDVSVSIVMPIYNSGDYLKESLGGLLQQTLKNIEIICVNDGSTDNSLDIIKYYAQDDKRILIVDNTNHGYGYSMNCGISVARGEYIGILEPDDFADNTMFESLYSIAKEKELDVIKSNYYEYSEKENRSNFFEVLSGLEYDKVTSAEENPWLVVRRPCIWSAIYRREFLLESGIKFTETPGASYQDTAFAFKVWAMAKRVLFVKEPFLHYRIDNDNSSVKSSGKIFSICDEYQNIHAFLNENLEKKNRFIKILQVLKLDGYLWNLDRISDEFKLIFSDQIAIEYIKAEYEGVLDPSLFDSNKWKDLQQCIQTYQNKEERNILDNRYSELNDAYQDLTEQFNEIKNSNAYKVGNVLLYIPWLIKEKIKSLTKGV